MTKAVRKTKHKFFYLMQQIKNKHTVYHTTPFSVSTRRKNSRKDASHVSDGLFNRA